MNDPLPTFLIGSNGSQAPQPGMLMLASIIVIILIDLACIRYCLDDLNRRVIVNGIEKSFWSAVIILGGPVGQIVYMQFGRRPY
jgi:hypothetical protein